MRNRTTLQQKIAALTNNGDDILRFLAETMRGEIPGAKACHRMEAARHLMRLDSSDDSCESSEEASQFWGLIPTPEELAANPDRHSCEGRNPEGQGKETDNSELTTENSPVTYLDILNYEVAHLIRTETADGHTIVKFLADVMNSRDKPYTPRKLRIRQTDRMAAAREIMRRGLGHFGRRRKLVHDDYEADDYDTLHTDLAKRMREYSQHGADVVRFLLDVMSDTSLAPEEAYTWHHRTSAALELLRRGWDTNYDNITPEMLQAYWRDQQSSRLSVGQKKRLAGLPAFTDEYDQYDTTDYEAIAKDLREQEDREALAQKSLPSRRGKARMGVKSPESSASKNSTERESGNSKPPLPAGEGWGEGESPFPKIELNNREATIDRHSRKAGNPAASENPLSPRERVRVRGSEEPWLSQSTPTTDCETTFTDNDLDCFVKPLNPEDQAIFDYQTRLEFSDFEEEEITFQPPSEAAWQEYRRLLAQITEAAAAAGVPLLPNPLAGTLRRPAIRSP